MHKHHSTRELASTPTDAARAIVRDTRPVQPVTLVRPHAAARAARFFVEKFPGRSMYAVKANPSPHLLQILWDSGITHYDVASIAEVRLVRATRDSADLAAGASPRAAVLLANAARARAALDARDYVLPDDVKALAASVLRHRLLLSPAAEIEGKQVEALVADLVEATEAPR